MRLSIGVAALAAVLFASPVPAWALTPAVHDDAGFFTADAVSKADEIIKDIKERHRKDLLIETFPTAPAGKEEGAKGDDGKANPRFFAAWALQRARAEHVNGIYVLICKEPRYIEPAVGNKTHDLFSDDDRDHLGKVLIDHFKQKQYDEGLLEGVRYVQSTLDRNDSPKEGNKEAEGQAPSQQGPDTWSPYGGGHSTAGGVGGLPLGLGGCLCVGLVVIGVLAAGAMAVSALFRSFGHGPAGYGPGPGGYGPGGYGPGGYGGQGGGFMSSILGGLFGGAAGSWAYDRFFGGHSSPTQGPWQAPNAAPPSAGPAPDDTGYSAGGGGDFGGGDSGGGGGDFGGGDAGGGDGGGGGDFGGGGDASGGGGF